MNIETSSNNIKHYLSRTDTSEHDRLEFKRCAFNLCSQFLAGPWKNRPIEDFEINEIKGGMSNILFLCEMKINRNQYCPGCPNRVLMRVYFNPQSEEHLVSESVIFTLLSERRLGPKLYGIFNGGRLEEFIPSRPLSCEELSISSISMKIAKRVAAIHKLDVPIPKEPHYIMDVLRRWLMQLKSQGKKSYTMQNQYKESTPTLLTMDTLEAELQTLEKCLTKSKSLVTFCHNDLQEGNILLLKQRLSNIRVASKDDENFEEKEIDEITDGFMNPRLVIIDFEYASYNYRGFDFANHFIEYTMDYDVKKAPYFCIKTNQFPSDNHMIEFFKAYLKEMNVPLAKSVTEARLLLDETLPFIPVSHLFWGIWGLLQVELSPINFGFLEYGLERLALYFLHKDKLLKLLHEELE